MSCVRPIWDGDGQESDDPNDATDGDISASESNSDNEGGVRHRASLLSDSDM